MIQQLNKAMKLPCGATLQNRIAKAALTERIAKADHLPNERHYTLYENWAKNNAALLLTGNIIVDKRYLESIGNIVIEKETSVESFKKWTTKVLAHGNHFWAQISHAGRQSSIFSTRRPVSASDVQLKKMGFFGKAVPLSEAGIEEVIQRFVHAISFCQRVGFTGVEIHAAHGYLISQFLSPITNKRTDKWGGSIENRARLLFEIIGRARKAVGHKFPIAVKLNSADFQRGGFDEMDSKYVVKALESRGIDLVEISGGTYEMTAMFGFDKKESTRQREAYFLEFAKTLRQDCQLPLMVTGGFRTRAIAEQALANNELDVVGFGRPFLVDANFPKGFLEGTLDRIDIPKFKVLDSKNKDIVETSFYDLLIKQLSKEEALNFNFSGLKLATHIPLLELKMWIRNRLFS